MSSSKQIGGQTVKDKDEVMELIPQPVAGEAVRLNPRDYGFVGHVSDRAKAAIQRNANRASRVMSTSTRFAFR